MISRTLRYSLALLSIYEFREAIRWIQNPEDQEKSLDGILVSSGCSTTTSSENICAAYGRVMAWALAGLGLARLVCSVGSGAHVWSAGVLSHAIETCFWWKEYLARPAGTSLAIKESAGCLEVTFSRCLCQPRPDSTFFLIRGEPHSFCFCSTSY